MHTNMHNKTTTKHMLTHIPKTIQLFNTTSKAFQNYLRKTNQQKQSNIEIISKIC